MDNNVMRKLKPLAEDELRNLDAKNGTDQKAINQAQKLNPLAKSSNKEPKQNSNNFKSKLSPLETTKTNTDQQESPRSSPSSPTEPYPPVRRKSLTPIGNTTPPSRQESKTSITPPSRSIHSPTTTRPNYDDEAVRLVEEYAELN